MRSKKVRGKEQKHKGSKMKQKTGKERNTGSTQAEMLIDIVEDMKCFQTPDNECFGVLNRDHKEVYELKRKEFRDYLKEAFFKKYGKMPSTQALQDTINVLEHRARANIKPVYVRIGKKKKKTYIDLGDNTRKAIRIDSEKINVVSKPSVYFRRPRGILELPEPAAVKKGIKVIENFMDTINASKTDQRLIIAWALSALKSSGPYPILVLQGEQGSGKSTIAKMLKLLIDPTIAPLRALPKNERDLAIYARNNWVLAFDNVSFIPSDISDAICRLSTGGGLSVRQLYTDTDEVIFDVTRPMILNGIGNIIYKNDLADRTLVVSMKRITDEDRRPEEELWKDFEKNRPKILSALAHGVRRAIRNLKKVDLPWYTRLADSLKWIVASEPAIFRKPGKFVAAYEKNRKNISFICLESDPLAAAIKNLINTDGRGWRGEANDLLIKLEDQLPEEHKERILREKSWPKAANSLSRRLKELAPILRVVDIEINFKRSPNKRIIKIRNREER